MNKIEYTTVEYTVTVPHTLYTYEPVTIKFRYRRKYHSLPLKAGYGDTIHARRYREFVYICGIRRNLGYVGLQVFNVELEVMEENELFFYDYDLLEEFGWNMHNLEDISIMSRLVRFWHELE
jgi:hypothetical protein